MRLRMLTALTTLLAFVMTLVWPGGASAQQQPPPPPTSAPPNPPPAPPPGAPDDAAMAQAKQHFEAGKNAYNAGDYVTAIREFKAAETLRPSPILDYNIGLGNEKLGKKRVAVKYYRRYLNLQPNARNKDEVEQRINGLEAQIAQEPPPATTAQPGGSAPQPNTVEQPSDMPPPDTSAGQPAPTPGYDPYASPPPPGYAVQPVKKKKSHWWIALIIAGAATLTVVAIVLAVYFTTASTATTVTPFDHSPSLTPNAERIDRHDVGATLFRF